MHHFIITEESTNECNSCCCKAVHGSPGEIDRWTLDFAPWAVPIAGKGISEIVVNVESLYVPNMDGKPVANKGSFTTPYNVPVMAELSTLVDNPDSVPLTYRLIPFYGPNHGKIQLDSATGDFTYTPRNAYSGVDSFFYEVTTSSGFKTIAQVLVGVAAQGGAAPVFPDFTPSVAVPDSRIELNARVYRATLAVVISPAARVGEIHRVTIKTTALDCDCNPFINLSCFDLTIGKC